jgi:hypothetical protein
LRLSSQFYYLCHTNPCSPPHSHFANQSDRVGQPGFLWRACRCRLGLRPTIQNVDIGDVAQTTMQSPRDIEYVSEIRTEEARKAAESAVLPVYSSPDPAIARQQIDRLAHHPAKHHRCPRG